jgi:hypothetical protein
VHTTVFVRGGQLAAALRRRAETLERSRILRGAMRRLTPLCDGFGVDRARVRVMDPLALQRNVRHNASEIQNAIADLTSWEDTIKTRDKKLLKVRTDARAEPPATPACRQAHIDMRHSLAFCSSRPSNDVRALYRRATSTPRSKARKLPRRCAKRASPKWSPPECRAPRILSAKR